MHRENTKEYYEKKIQFDRDLFISKLIDEYAFQLEVKETNKSIIRDILNVEDWNDLYVIERYEEVFND